MRKPLERTLTNKLKSKQGGMIMFVKFKIPEKASAAIRGLKPYQQVKVLQLIEDKTKFLFQSNSHNLYPDIHNYASFDDFLSSIIITNTDVHEINYFFDENMLSDGIVEDLNFENNLFDNLLKIKDIKQDDYIERTEELKVDIFYDLEKYFSVEFWKEFNRFS